MLNRYQALKIIDSKFNQLKIPKRILEYQDAHLTVKIFIDKKLEYYHGLTSDVAEAVMLTKSPQKFFQALRDNIPRFNVNDEQINKKGETVTSV